MERSTRLSILEHALTDTVERLAELPPSADIDRMRALASEYELQVERWPEAPPDEATRIALLKKVLDLGVAVIQAGGGSKRPDPPDSEEEEGTAPFRLIP